MVRVEPRTGEHAGGAQGDAQGDAQGGARNGFQPSHLLLTLLGDYWLERSERLPSAALVQLTGEFGVSPAAARAALSRLRRRGLLDAARDGRHTAYGLTGRARRVLADGRRRIMAFGLAPAPWDGTWTVAAFSVPEAHREVRHVLRTRLRWLGFAPLYDGVWVSPRDAAGQALEALREVGVERITVMSATVLPGGPDAGAPITAWDLDDLRAEYDRFVAGHAPLLERVRRGRVGAAEALVARTALMDQWRNFPNLDPELPDRFLPPGWPRRRARDIFAEVYNGLGPPAEGRVRETLAAHAPHLAGFVRHHTTPLGAAGGPGAPESSAP
jgi:phenylacetic acid degradation operon negative regulatory protein